MEVEALAQETRSWILPGNQGLNTNRLGMYNRMLNVSAVDGIQGQKGRALGHESRLHKQVGALLEPGSESLLMRGGTHLGLIGELLGLMGGSLVL